MRKAAANYRKHGISFADAATALDDPQALTIEDQRFVEQRFVTVGLDASGRLLVVVYTLSGFRRYRQTNFSPEGDCK